jgi:23S rRNA (cytidine1920-2'-O)/16S rRNA (cytidine1409-2'-O)-methyltransferase
MIKKGLIEVNGCRADKSSLLVTDGDEIRMVGDQCPYISRGGLKLAAALDGFEIAVKGCTCLDVGSSTGGFTDCLLKHGASKVIGIDVGHGQMDPCLAADYRVENREGVNARYLSVDDFETKFKIIVIDVSFISLTLILPAVSSLLAPAGLIIALVKPQFEVGHGHLGKGGVVRDAGERNAALWKVTEFAQRECRLSLRGTMPSPIEGGDGNHEFLACFESP